MKTRDLLRQLRQLGARPVRQSGTSHQVWELPDGSRVPIVVSHLNREVSRNVVAQLRRALGACALR